MKICYFELVGFERFAVNNIARFVYEPTEPVQLILGTNGCGKSSLIKELSPMPADQDAFSKDGSKVIKIAKNGKIYTLTTVFTPSTRHSFKIDGGEELNKGGTQTVQKDLIKFHLGYSSEIHNMLTGVEPFHSMSAIRKREWFTMLSDVSYDYAMQVYARLKERVRDTSGALKLNKKRLVAEAAKVISKEEEEALRHDVDITVRELNLLIENNKPIERTFEDINSQYDKKLGTISMLADQLLRMKIVAPYGTYSYGINPLAKPFRDDWGNLHQPGFKSIEEVEQVIDHVRHQITTTQTLLNKAAQNNSKLQEKYNILQKTGEASIKQLQDKVKAFEDKKQEVLQRRKLPITTANARQATQAVEAVYETLSALFSEMPSNEDRRFSQANLQELKTKQFANKDEIEQLKQKHAKLTRDRDIVQSHKDNGHLQCVKCGFRWIEGFNEKQLESLNASLEDLNEAIKQKEVVAAKLQEDIDCMEHYFEQYREYSRIVKSWTVLQSLWEYLNKEKYVVDAPRMAKSTLDTYLSDLRHCAEAESLDEQIRELKSLIAQSESLGDTSLAQIKEELNQSTLELENLTFELRTLTRDQTAYSQYRAQLKEAFDLGEQLRRLMEDQKNLNDERIEAFRRATIAHCIKQLQISLATKNEALQQAMLQKGIVKDLEDSIAKLEIEEEAVKVLTRELSPTEGLIAEGLLGFIRNFIAQMNSFIKKTWSYPMQVLDCSIEGSENAELDYRFPLMVGHQQKIVPDIKFASAGQQEIIDLAFRVVAAKHLNLADAPLYLDEFGKGMDEQHRHTATMLVQQLMETHSFPQLFMISHYSANYGAFANAQTLVLDATNVVTPERYNEHVTLQ